MAVERGAVGACTGIWSRLANLAWRMESRPVANERHVEEVEHTRRVRGCAGLAPGPTDQRRVARAVRVCGQRPAAKSPRRRSPGLAVGDVIPHRAGDPDRVHDMTAGPWLLPW